MTNSKEYINKIINNQREFFQTGITKSISYRIEQLRKLKEAINKFENRIYDALWQDLHKSKEEAYLTEISIVTQEIDNHIKHLKRWAKPKGVPTPLYLLPSSSKIVYEPLGVSLIIAPWNYPFQLLFNPLVGAISAGCCIILKPSPYASNTSNLMENIIKDTFDSSYIDVIQGGKEVNQLLIKQRFDIIFFTGSPSLGKIVMEAAAKHLTPVVLELGGKSPVIVDKDADISVAAKRIIWGKTINAGQTCIAPDYAFVHESVKEELIDGIKLNINKLYGKDIKSNSHYARIINEKAFNRIVSYIKEGSIIVGGDNDKSERFIAPTIIDNIDFNSNVMKEEIFGPVLPIITFTNIDEAIIHINENEKPLALYYFGKSKFAKNIIHHTSSGGTCINDTIIHVANNNLPFGGVGNSGMGKYHGKDSFKIFSNQRSIIKSSTKIDFSFRYPPYKMFKWIKKII